MEEMSRDIVETPNGFLCVAGCAGGGVAMCTAVCVADTVSPVGDVVGAKACLSAAAKALAVW